ncbi:MAG: mannose-6-phosphate isomerase, class I, partial [Halioglobus sp.]|nr:mannose-6-phosphate isomerase, class I [Halioglobus sp.]
MRAATLLRLENSIKDYAWGDARRLPELFGLENPDGAPQAEIWMGAHPADPSRVRVDGELQALDGLIASDPGRILGADVAARFDGRLPFLFKVLNAGQPLSIQLHPDKATAEAGFARENEAGIPLDASHRNYADPNHKPELICALTPFRALCGFRPYEEICAALTLLDAPQLDDALQRLRDEPGSDALKALCLTLLDLGQNDVSALLEIALQRAVEVEREDFNELCLLHEYYPGDRGVLFALLLNRVELQPGEALFLGAGNVHSYLGGVGLEIMA